MIGHHEPTAEGFDTINSNDIEGARAATQVLIDRGYRDIGMLSLGPVETHEPDVAPQREKGFRAAVEAAGMPARIFRFDNLDAARAGKIAALLTAADRPRALFVWSDLDGILVLNAARQMGLRVPEDLALIAYDNSPVAALPLIDLASMDQHGARLGALATETLLGRIKGRRIPHHLQLDPTVVLRSSL